MLEVSIGIMVISNGFYQPFHQMGEAQVITSDSKAVQIKKDHERSLGCSLITVNKSLGPRDPKCQASGLASKVCAFELRCPL